MKIDKVLIEGMLDGLKARHRDEAMAQGQWTLGMLEEALKRFPETALVTWEDGTGLRGAHSYRGYYEQLGFEGGGAHTTVGVTRTLLAACHRIFEGYKGGDFPMHSGTLIWHSEYGCSGGRPIIGVEERAGVVIVLTKDAEDA